MHLGCGHSLRETVVRARRAGAVELSQVAPMKRLARSGPWLRSLCRELFSASGGGFDVRPVDTAIELSHRKLRRKASKKSVEVKQQNFKLAEHVIAFTTFLEAVLAPEAVQNWYRLRWQVEFVFKRFKSVAQFRPSAQARR